MSQVPAFSETDKGSTADNILLRPAVSDSIVATLLSLVTRNRRIVLGSTGLGLGLAALYLAVAAPMYRAVVEVSIDPVQITRLQQDVPQRGSGSVDSGLVDSQVELIKSNKIAENVVDAAGLATLKPSGGWLSEALEGLGLREPSAGSMESRRSKAVAAFSRGLTVKRAGLSYVIEISYVANDPDLAAKIANQTAQAYIDEQLKAGYDAASQASVWLKERLDQLRLSSQAASSAVVEFRSDHQIATSDGKLLDEQQLSTYASKVTEASAQLEEARARLDQIRAVNASENSDFATAESLRNEVITRLRNQLVDAQRRFVDLSSRFGPEHGASINARNDAVRTKGAIAVELNRVAEVARSDFQIAQTRLAAARKAYEDFFVRTQQTLKSQVKVQELEAQARTLQTMHENFLQRYTRTLQQQSFPISEARVIAPAAPPVEPAYPRRSLTLLLGLGLGAGLGVGMGLFRQLADRKVRTRRQAELIVGAPCVGVAPLVRPEPLGRPLTPDEAFGKRGSALTLTLDKPLSHFAETTRSARLAIDIAPSERGKVVGMLSMLSGEGKSTIASNLAFQLAQTGSRTILIDCDLRNPTLSGLLNPVPKTGLPELLAGEATLGDVLITDPVTRLDFLTAGHSTNLANTSDLIASRPMRALIDALRSRYDYVVIDFPPLVPVVDVRAAPALVDGFLLVIGWGAVDAKTLDDALGSAPEVWGKIIGSVLNRAELTQLEHYGENVQPYYDKRYLRA